MNGGGDTELRVSPAFLSPPGLTLSLSLCFAAAAVLNTAIQAPVQPAQPLQAAVQPRPPLQPPSVFPTAPGQPPILPQPSAAPTPPVAKPLETQTQITVQPAGFAFNPGIVRSLAARGVEPGEFSTPLSGALCGRGEPREVVLPRGRSTLVELSSLGGSCEIPTSVSPFLAKDDRPSRMLCLRQNSEGWI